MEHKLWDLYTKAIDLALDAETSDVAAMGIGLQAAQWVHYRDGKIKPPTPIRDVAEIDRSMLSIDPVSLEVGPELARLADPATAGELIERLKHVRQQIAREFGVIAPGVRVRPHMGLDPGAYQIRINGNLVGSGEVLTTHVLGIGSDLDVPGVNGELTMDPFTRTPAIWIPEHQASTGEQHGLAIFDAQDVVATHVAEIIKLHMSELLTREEVAALLNTAREDSPMVVQELVPNMLALGQLRQVLQNLVKERVPIKDLSTILNALADYAIYTKDPHALTEHVRAALARTICSRYRSADGTIAAFSLTADANKAVQSSIQLSETGQVLMLDPAAARAIVNDFAAAKDEYSDRMTAPIVFTSPKVRRHVWALLSDADQDVVVLSQSEIDRTSKIDVLARLGLDSFGKRPTDVDPRALPTETQSSAAQPVGDWLSGG